MLIKTQSLSSRLFSRSSNGLLNEIERVQVKQTQTKADEQKPSSPKVRGGGGFTNAGKYLRAALFVARRRLVRSCRAPRETIGPALFLKLQSESSATRNPTETERRASNINAAHRYASA